MPKEADAVGALGDGRELAINIFSQGFAIGVSQIVFSRALRPQSRMCPATAGSLRTRPCFRRAALAHARTHDPALPLESPIPPTRARHPPRGSKRRRRPRRRGAGGGAGGFAGAKCIWQAFANMLLQRYLGFTVFANMTSQALPSFQALLQILQCLATFHK